MPPVPTPDPNKPKPAAAPAAKPAAAAPPAAPTPAPAEEPVQQRADDTPDENADINEGWNELPEGAKPYEPEQMIPDREIDSADYAPDDYDKPLQYESADEADPDSPKAQLRRKILDENPTVYEGHDLNPPA